MDIFKKFSFINVKLMGDILTGLYCRQRPEQKKAEAGTRVPASAFFQPHLTKPPIHTVFIHL